MYSNKLTLRIASREVLKDGTPVDRYDLPLDTSGKKNVLLVMRVNDNVPIDDAAKWLGEQCDKCEPPLIGKGEGTQVMTFTPHTYEDLDVHPIHITSKRQLKRECEKRGLKAARLL